MSKTPIVMPQMGESITNGTIVKWTKKEGDMINLDEVLLEISTDKVNSEIPSPIKGRVEKLLYKEGDTIDVGLVIAEIEDDLSVPFTAGASISSAKEAPKAAPAAVAPVATPSVYVEEVKEDRFYTPLVKAMAKEANVPLSELSHIKGSGAAGRVNREDFESFLKTRGSNSSIAPVKSAPAPAQAAPAQVFNFGSAGTQVIPMDNMRKAIAKNMVLSKQTSPHVNSIGEVDMSHLVKFREAFKNEFEKQEGFKLTYTPFILKALIMALKEYPLVNASIDGDNIIVKKDINLGCAVAVPGNGLVVPNIKGADALSMVGLCRALNQLAQKARAKKLTMDELTGGTFTFTNVGSFGTLLATPIILQPQLGIYAAGVIQKRVMVMEDDAIAVRSMMYGTHTYDHRLVDGELGGKFLEAVHRNLKTMDPKSLFAL
ncbi:MAG: dihydrolipoamide acetyltransferase family protein [Bacteriovoracaceae bacterium]